MKNKYVLKADELIGILNLAPASLNYSHMYFEGKISDEKRILPLLVNAHLHILRKLIEDVRKDEGLQERDILKQWIISGIQEA